MLARPAGFKPVGPVCKTEALEKIKRRVGRVIKRTGAFGTSDYKETLGYGRTVAIPVLEYLDTIAFTRRQGDPRYLMNATFEKP